MRVLIVGAGPTGLTAGVELARQGVDVTVIDKRDNASGSSRAVGILPMSLDLLAPSGVTPHLLDHGIPLHEARIYRGATPVVTLPFSGPRPRSFLLALPQDRTEEILRDAFLRFGGVLRYSVAFHGLRPGDSGITVTLGDGSEDRFDVVIGADGVHSTVRECLGIDFHGYDLPETWSIVDVDGPGWLHPEAFTLCLMPGAREVVVAPIGPDRYRLVSNTENALDTLPLPLDVRHIHRQGQFRIAIRQVDTYQDRKVFLAGDAAHCHSPVGGRGMNLGIADAAELARRLLDGTTPGYSASRHKAGKETIAASEMARKFLMARNPVVAATRRVFFFMVSSLPPLQRVLARQVLFP